MVSNVTFNNISVISWWSVLLVEENEMTQPQSENQFKCNNHPVNEMTQPQSENQFICNNHPVNEMTQPQSENQFKCN